MKKKTVNLRKLHMVKDRISNLTDVKATGGAPRTAGCNTIGCPIYISNLDTSPCTTVNAPCVSVSSCEQSACQNMPPCATLGC